MVVILLVLVILKIVSYCRPPKCVLPGPQAIQSFENPCYEEFQNSPRRMSEDLVDDARANAVVASTEVSSNLQKVAQRVEQDFFENLVVHN